MDAHLQLNEPSICNTSQSVVTWETYTWSSMNFKITLSKYYVDQLVHQFELYILYKNTRDMP